MPHPVSSADILPAPIRAHLSAVVFELLKELGRLARARGDQEDPIKVAHFGVLACLAERGAMSQKAASTLLHIHAGDTVAVVDELEVRGYVQRQVDVQDRRRYALQITPSGRAALTERSARIATFDADAFRAAPAKDYAAVLKTLAKVVEDLRQRPYAQDVANATQEQWSQALRPPKPKKGR